MENNCLICKSELQYFQYGIDASCFLCGKEMKTEVMCKNKHFVCDTCHQKDAIGIAEQYCINSKETDAIKIAIELMRFKAFKMHGPEHHFLVPAVLITAYCNINSISNKKEKISLAKARACKVPGGFCGSHGSCGAAMGSGIFLSVITGTTPLSKETWKLSNLLTSESLYNIAQSGGPRCCKRDSFIAIETAVLFANKRLEAKMQVANQTVCEFDSYNKECLKKRCKFYK